MSVMQEKPGWFSLHLPNNQQQWLIGLATLTVTNVNIIIL